MLASTTLLALGAAALAAGPIPEDSRQLVLSVATSWDSTRAQVRRYERDLRAAPWRAVGAPRNASLGRSGLAWGTGLHTKVQGGPVKKEGDGRAPAGVFFLRDATGYEAVAPLGNRLPYRQATATLRCVDDPRSAHYNRLVDEAQTKKDWTSAEDMRRPDSQYRLVVWVGHNDDPPQPGLGSCIFLHSREASSAVTAGCTAFDTGVMEELMAWLDPKAKPVLVQLPRAQRRSLQSVWGLPPE
jgi:D-alanyl-D-alanine dipeptidase